MLVQIGKILSPALQRKLPENYAVRRNWRDRNGFNRAARSTGKMTKRGKSLSRFASRDEHHQLDEICKSEREKMPIVTTPALGLISDTNEHAERRQ